MVALNRIIKDFESPLISRLLKQDGKESRNYKEVLYFTIEKFGKPES
jgi:hypothetical protein